jgi:DNA (cytosine-5)-methyltransferase 1
LEAEGYEVQPFIIPAAAKNAPHRRDRCWFVAYNHGIIRGERGKLEYREQSRYGESNEKSNTKTNGNASDTNSRGLERSIEIGWNSEHVIRKNGIDTQTNNATDTEHKGLEGQHRKWKGCAEHRNNEGIFIGTEDKLNATDTDGNRQPGKKHRNQKTGQHCKNSQRNDWHNFPTESPICSGDDGLPTELDGITFPKWRNESIKGYGNAICPQIAYELFKIIEHESKNKTTQDKQAHHFPHE